MFIKLVGISLFGFVSFAIAQQVTIVSPPSGTVVAPGQAVTVTVSGSGVSSLALAGKDGTLAGPTTGSTASFTWTAPTGTAGPVNLIGVGVVDSTNTVFSSSVSIDVEPTASITSLTANAKSFNFRFPGGQGFLRASGTFLDSSTSDLTHSSKAQYSSANSKIAGVDASGIVTATDSGKTTITAAYGSSSFQVPVSVASSVRGDFNGDGRVTMVDLNILQGAVGLTPAGSFDARDLNGDGKIDANDVSIEQGLLTQDFTISIPSNQGFSQTGQPAVFTVNIQAAEGSFDGQVAFSCSNPPANATCSFSPATVSPGSTGAVTTLSIGSGAASNSSRRAGIFVQSASLLVCGLLLMGKRRTRIAFVAIALCSLLLLPGCNLVKNQSGSSGGGGSGAGGDQSGPSVTGNYNITVTGTSGQIVRSAVVLVTFD